MRLIDADEVKRFYETYFKDLDNGVHWSRNDIIMNLDCIETADIVPVIRCRNCKHRNDIEFSNGTLHLCERFDKTAAHRINDLDSFCSWGERKDAFQVIRCKDCHFYKSENLQCMMHEGDKEEWHDNDYCSLAERKEE